MLDALIRWSLHHRAVVLFLAAALLIWGGYSIREVPLDVLPDLTAPTVTILVEARGMVPAEMESLVTFPIESAINGAPGVRRVRSATLAWPWYGSSLTGDRIFIERARP
jgi:Cu/Ag efflux pump CusA